MAYTVQFSNKNIVVQPGTSDSTSTYLTFVGRYVTDYGNIIAQDLANLMQNFASNTQPDPARSVPGQLWYNNVDHSLNVFDGTNYRSLSYDNNTNAIAHTQGELIIDDQVPPQTHHVLSSFIGTVRYSILSPDQEFTPATAITGFATIKPGLNIADSTILPNGNISVGATDAQFLAGVPVTGFMRTDTDTGTVGHITIGSPDGLFLGSIGQSQIRYDSDNIDIKNNQPDGSINFYTHDSRNRLVNPVQIQGDGTVFLTGNLQAHKLDADISVVTQSYSRSAVVSNVYVQNLAYLGSNNNVMITGGLSNQVLTTDGTGRLFWTDKTVTTVAFPLGDLGVAKPDEQYLGMEINSLFVYDCATQPIGGGLTIIDLGLL